MKIKLTSFNAFYIPDFKFKDEAGNTVNNKDLPENEQIKTEITLATIDQRSKYISLHTYCDNLEDGAEKTVTNYNFKTCISTHVKKIIGLEELGIKTGYDLANYPAAVELNELMQDLFLKINGVKAEDKISSKK